MSKFNNATLNISVRAYKALRNHNRKTIQAKNVAWRKEINDKFTESEDRLEIGNKVLNGGKKHGGG